MAEVDALCKVCTHAFKGGDKSISCDVCLEWMHIKCVGIAPDKYKYLNDEQISWCCGNCKGAAKTLKNQMIDFKKQMDAMKSRMDELERNQVTEEKVNTMIKQAVQEDLDEQIKDVVKMEMVAQGATVNRVGVNQIRDAVQEYMADVVAGEKKLENLIIHRLKEPEEQDEGKDKEEVEKIFKHIKPDSLKEDIKAINRLGQKEEGKTRPLLVKLRNAETAKELLKNARKLKGSDWNVSLEIDRTKKVREYVKYIQAKAIKDKGDDAQNFLFRVVGDPGQERVVVRKKNEAREEATETS